MTHYTKYRYIVKEEGSRGARAVIEGTSLAVWHIANDYKRRLSVDEIVQKQSLTHAQVHSALAYYFDHKAEIYQTRRDDRLEDLCAKADRSGIGESFRALVAAGQKHNLPWYVHKSNGVRFAPPADRRLVLFYVRAKPVLDQLVSVYITRARFPRFYPVTEEEVTQLLGPVGERHMTRAEVDAFVQGLDQIFARIEPPSELNPSASRADPNDRPAERPTLDALYTRADNNGIGKGFRVLVDAATKHLTLGRVYAGCIRFSPPKNRVLTLMDVYAAPRRKRDPKARVWVGTNENGFWNFYPVSQEEVTALLGPQGYRDLTDAEVETFVQGLDQLFDLIKSRSEATETQ